MVGRGIFSMKRVWNFFASDPASGEVIDVLLNR